MRPESFFSQNTTLQNAPSERPACFAFPERGSSWHKYYQPSGYHYFTNKPALLNMLCMPGVLYSMHQHRYHAYNRQAYYIYNWLVWVDLLGWLVWMLDNATCTAVIDNINERITCNIACKYTVIMNCVVITWISNCDNHYVSATVWKIYPFEWKYSFE